MTATVDLDKKFEEFKQAYTNMMRAMAVRLARDLRVDNYNHHPVRKSAKAAA